jgi:hypothetical protein
MRRAAPVIIVSTRWLVRVGMIAIWLLSMALFVSVSVGYGQEVEDIAPPPLKMIPKEEKARLTGETQPKSRTGLALQMMGESLARAEQLDSKNKFVEMYRELGTFHAIMDDTLNFLYSRRDNAILKNFKKLEMGLRSFAPRLEVMRRDLPIQYEPYVKSLIKYVQDTREKAIEPFYGNTVVPNSRNQ